MGIKIDIFGSVSSIATSGTSPIDQIDLAAQLGTTLSSQIAAKAQTPAAYTLSLMASGTAFQTGLGKLINDWGNVSDGALFGDITSLVGDADAFVGSIAGLTRNAAVAQFCERTGGLLTLTGAMISDYDAIQQYTAGSPQLAALIGQTDYLLTQTANYENEAAQEFESAGSSLSATWTSFNQYFSNMLGSATDALSDFGDPKFQNDWSSFEQNASELQSTLDSAVTSAGVAVSDISENANGSSENIGLGDDSVPVASLTYTQSDPTTLIVAIDTLNDDGSVASTTTYSDANGFGLLTSSDQENADGTSQITTYDPDGTSTTTYYTGPNGTGTITEIDQENPDGTSQITTYGPDGFPTTIDYDGPDGTGDESNSSTVEDGNNGGRIIEVHFDGPDSYADPTSIPGTYSDDPYSGGDAIEVDDAYPGDSAFIGLPPSAVSAVEQYGGTWTLDDVGHNGVFYWDLFDAATDEANLFYDQSVSLPSADSVVLVPGTNGELAEFDQDTLPGATVFSLNGVVTVTVNSGSTTALDPLFGDSNITSDGTIENLTINGPGVATFGAGLVAVSANGVVISSDAQVRIEGVPLFTDPITVDAGGNISGYGTITGEETVNGTVTADGGTLDITGDVDGSGTLTFTPGAALQLEGTITATGGVVFTGESESLILGPSAAVQVSISGFGPTDTIALEGQQVTSAVYDPTDNQLAVTSSTGSVFDLTFAGTYQQSDFPVTDGEIMMPCFMRGTRIATRRGQVAVEHLRIGDLVPTQFGGMRRVKWIGYRRVDCRRHPKPEEVWPVRVRAGAFDDGVPHCDLWLSPDHAVFADGALIQIRQLVNGTSIAQTRLNRVTYFHVELDRHDVLFAEGLPAESYLDTGNRAAFENAGMPLPLHPRFARTEADSRAGESCAPLVVAADRTEPVWRRLAARASMLGCPVSLPAATTEPDLRLAAGGRQVKPIETIAGRHVFLLPARTEAVQIISRAGAPTALRPWLDDRRRLGVSVGRIVLRGKSGPADIPVDHPALAHGWHDVERAGHRLWRWTDGAAAVPVIAGARVMEIHLAGCGKYPLLIPSKNVVQSFSTCPA